MTKRKWCDMIWGLFANDPLNKVERIEYEASYPEECGGADEVVEIEYYSGYTARINVTANSHGAILHEIVAEVYGPGAFGTFWRGFRKKEEEEA